MTVTPIVHSFSAGEISPALHGRVDLDKWHAAASAARSTVVSYVLVNRGASLRHVVA